MSASKQIDRVCAAGIALSLLLCILYMNGAALGLEAVTGTMGYETRLFDTSRVHTVDLVMDDWDSFLDTCENEEYAACAAVIDGEAYKNIGIRAKGNTSLSTVSQLGSDRYSFKLEFDRYDSGKSYYGLDKLCLNNLIQDNTMMKDYLTYQMMNAFGVAAPLCSYVYITVNGEDWGLYLAVEGVEDAFLRRNYGSNSGELYKPDSMSFGAGRGNGRDFDMSEFMDRDTSQQAEEQTFSARLTARLGTQDFTPPEGTDFTPPEGMQDFTPPEMPGNGFAAGGFNFGGGFGMGSDDVKLKYSDDDPNSYANIFDNAKTDISDGDRTRLIQALKTLSSEEASGAVDVDAVLRYFAVHNFVVNGDSYTGGMVHNYYLYEKDGLLSMIPWDYNLAFGTFQSRDAASAVNDPIDSPLSVSGNGDRPMADWIFQSESNTRLYHQYLREFLDTVDPTALIEEAGALIAPYVERDPTKFCTYEEFEAGVEALKMFCDLRAESVEGQLVGTIPSTSAGQSADNTALVDAAGLTLSDMGTMNQGGGPGGFPQQGGDFPQQGSDSVQQGDEQPAQFPGEGMPEPSGETDAAQPDSQPQEQESSAPPDLDRNRGEDRQPPDGGFPGGGMTQGGTQTSNGPVLLAVSVLVLAVGLAAAFAFKRR